jgi:hypothetical protein
MVEERRLDFSNNNFALKIDVMVLIKGLWNKFLEPFVDTSINEKSHLRMRMVLILM